MFFICAEKVDKLCSMLCSSPMSANTEEKMLTALRSSQGICRPHCVIRQRRPSVFKLTVLPPVFGPVMTSVSKLRPSSMSMGTAFAGSSSG